MGEGPVPEYLPEELPAVSTPPAMLRAGSVGGGAVVSGGTFKLEMEANGGVVHGVIFCDGPVAPVVLGETPPA